MNTSVFAEHFFSYVLIKKAYGSYRKGAAALGIGHGSFRNRYKKELGLCVNTSCQNPPEVEKTRCRSCLDRMYSQIDTERKNSKDIEWAKNNPDKFKVNQKKYRQSEKGKSRRRESNRLYALTAEGAANNKLKYSKRRATKKCAVPSWADMYEIKEFYKNCPEGFEVDHIFPLQNNDIQGLHVIENLQYLPRAENRAKSNKFPEGVSGCAYPNGDGLLQRQLIDLRTNNEEEEQLLAVNE